MPRTPIRPEDITDPSRIIDNMINDYVSGELDRK